MTLGDNLAAQNISVAVNETWFFREPEPLQAWRDSVLPDLMQTKDQIRFWSAGCSTGEEPYTMAMLLLDAYPLTAEVQFSILATDINQHALDLAKDGLYDPYSLRHTQPGWVGDYFEPAQDGRHTVCDRIRQMVHFEWSDAANSKSVLRGSPFDLILCRNVLIHLDKPARRSSLANFYNALYPGGYLILGHSESLIYRPARFEAVRVGGRTIYRKPIEG